MVETPSGTDSASRRHEERDVQPRLILLCGLGLVVITTLVLLLAYWLFDDFVARRAQVQRPPAPLAETRQPPPEPRLQVIPAQDLQQRRATEDAVLASYGWLDQTTGLVRIPIDRAIELVVERGLPVWPKPQTPQTKDGATPAPAEGG